MLDIGLSLAVSMELDNLRLLQENITYHTGKRKLGGKALPLADYIPLFRSLPDNSFNFDGRGYVETQRRLIIGVHQILTGVNYLSTTNFMDPKLLSLRQLDAYWNHYLRTAHVLTCGDNFKKHELPYLVDEDKICSFALKLWDTLHEATW